MAPDQSATDSVLYSWDEGLTWDTLQFAEYPIEVTNIIIEPTNTATNFVLYGEDMDGQGVVVALDFSSLHKGSCKGADSPNSD